MGKKPVKKAETSEASSEDEVQVEQPKADKKRKQAEIAKPEKKDKKAEKKGKQVEKEEKKPEKKDKKAEKQAPAAPTPSKKEKNGKSEKKEAKKEKKAPPPPHESSSEDEEEEKDEVEEEKEEAEEDGEEAEKDEEEDGNDAKKAKFDEDAQGEVFLSNCPESIDDSDIKTLFDGLTIHNIKWLSKQGVFSGRGFVKMGAADVTKALKLSGTEIKGSAIDIALPKTPTNVAGEPGDVKVIFMGNLPFSIEESQIRELFADCGEITEIRWGMRDGEFKGYAHVEFDSNTNAQKAVALTGTDIGGREVRIDLSLPRVGGGGGDRGGRGGFGGGRGGRGGFGGDRGGRGGFGGGRGGGRGGFGGDRGGRGGFGGGRGGGGRGGFGGRGGGGGRGGRGGGGFAGTRTTF